MSEQAQPNGHDPKAAELLRMVRERPQEPDDALLRDIGQFLGGGSGGGGGNKRLINVVVGIAFAALGASGAGVYGLVSQADEISKLPAAVNRITTVLAGDQDEWGKRRPGLIERFEQQGEAMTEAVQTLTVSVESLSARMDAVERTAKSIETNVVPGPPEKP